jgi:[ribosomal protein S18]-alanine N-acetyltransferase
MVVERFRWWHIEEVLPIEEDLFGVERWTAAMFWNELANGHHYVAGLDEDEVVGYAGLAITPGGEAWINNLAVRRDRQRRGLGRVLLADLLDHARREGADQVLLEVAADNGPAQRLYDGHGFLVIGVRRGYYQPSNTDALVMRRERP